MQKKILYVEDNKIDRMAFQRFLSKEMSEFSTSLASSFSEAKELLKDISFDIIVSDYNLGDGRGSDLIFDNSNVPFIILTGAGNEEIAVGAMKAGAYDYIIKDVDGNYLKTIPHTIKKAIEHKEAQEELKQYREGLEKLVIERTKELQEEIARRINAEQVLKESEERYRLLVEQSPNGIYIHIDGRVDFVNKAGLKLLGLNNVEQLVGMPANELIHSRFRLGVSFEDVVNFNKEEEIQLEERKLVRYDGTFIFVELLSVPFLYKGKTAVQTIARDVSSKKKAEYALRESEEKFRTLVEESIDGVIMINRNGKIIEWNKGMEKITALAKHEVLFRQFVDVEFSMRSEDKQSTDDYNKLNKAIEYTLQTGKNILLNQLMESTFVNQRGEEKSIQILPFTVKTSFGILLVLLTRDITEQMRNRKELKKSKEELELAIRGGNLGMWHWYLDTDRIIFNDRWAEMLGYEQSDTKKIRKNWRRLVHPDDQSAIDYALRKHAEGEASQFEVEYRMKSKNDNWVWLLSRGTIQEWKDGKPLKISGTNIDISSRKVIEENLAASKQTLAAILDSSPIGTALVNSEMIIWGNPALYEILEYSDDELIDKCLLELFENSEDYDNLLEKSKLNEKQDGMASLECKMLKKNGNTVDCAIMVREIDSQDKSKGRIFAIMDITERKNMQHEQEVLMKLKYQTEKKQNEARQLIENSTRIASIGVIAGGVTHEINQPLNAIKMGSDGIILWNKQNSNVLPDRIVNILNVMSEATGRIGDIIKHMRSFWIDSSKKEVEEVNLNIAAQKAIKLLGQRLSAHDTQLHVELEDQDLNILANQIQVELVINNLILNALNSLEEKKDVKRQIWLTTYKEKHDIFLKVSDNGIGLPDIKMDELFDPFFSTRKSGKGTGLGLAIVKMFLDRFEAKITAENNDMGGAVFKIRFNEYEI